jgi:hypothetical protein
VAIIAVANQQGGVGNTTAEDALAEVGQAIWRQQPENDAESVTHWVGAR